MSEQTTTMKEQLHELLAEQGDRLSYADAKKEIGDRLADHYFNKLKRYWIAARKRLHELLDHHGERLTYSKAQKEIGESISSACFDKLKRDWLTMKNDQPQHGNNGEASEDGPRARYTPREESAPRAETAPLPLASAAARADAANEIIAAREEVPAAAVAAMTATAPASNGGKVQLAAVMIEDILAAKALIGSVGKDTALRLIEVL